MQLKYVTKSLLPKTLFYFLKRWLSIFRFFLYMLKKYCGSRYLEVRLDTTNSCNLRCKYCYTLSYERSRPKTMTKDEFEKIANDLFLRSESVALSCAWEPLMNKHFADYISIAASYNIPHLFYVTNGQLLTDEVIKASILAPVHEVAISIDAATKNLYEEIRENALFETVINNLKKIFEFKKQFESVYPRITINYTVFEENCKDAPLFIQKYQEYIDTIYIGHLLLEKRNDTVPYSRMSDEKFDGLIKLCEKAIHNNSVQLVYSGHSLQRKPILCDTALRYVNVSSNGDVKLCTKKVVGNLFNNSLDEITRANKSALIKNYFAKDQYCRKCGV